MSPEASRIHLESLPQTTPFTPILGPESRAHAVSLDPGVLRVERGTVHKHYPRTV